MRTVTYKLIDKNKTICLGKVDENNATQVRFDAGNVFDEYPTAVPTLSIVNPEGVTYPGIVERDEDMVTWNVQNSDVAVEGTGEIQLAFTSGNTVVRSYIYTTRINRSIVSDNVPDPVDDWLTAAGAALYEIEHITASASGLPAGSDPTASYEDGVITFGIPQGAQGDPGQDGQDGEDGVSPTVAVTTITGGHTVTITDADGDHAFNVMDGSAGAVIDDTSTAADKVWSASKTNELKSAISKDNARLEKYDGGITVAWEIGTLSQNTDLTPPCGYAHGRNGICTSEGTTVHLYPGDTFSVTNFTGVKINAFGRKTSDSTTAIKSNQTDAIVIEYEGNYALSVAYTDTTVIADFNTLMALVVLKRYTNTIADVQNIQNKLKPYEDITLGNIMPNLSEWIVGRVYNGVYSDAITTVKCTDYIPVLGGKTYYIYGGYLSQEYFGVYDASKKVISGWSFTSVTSDANNASKAVITLNQNARFIRINAMVNKIAQFPTDAYIGLYPNNMPKELDVSDYVPRIKGNGTLSNKKILVIGDSISTDVYGSYKKWVTALCENCFFSSGYVNNNSYHATGYVATYKESGVVRQGTFLTRVSAITDLDEYDMIITFGGINDWIQSVDFEEFKDAVDDYYAYLIENATQARIAVIAPLRTSLYGTTNSVDKTQKDYSDYIKSVAADYSFPVLNLTDEGGFCPEKSTTFCDMWTLLPAGFVSHDGVHPTETWEKKYLAPQIAWFLAGLI